MANEFESKDTLQEEEESEEGEIKDDGSLEDVSSAEDSTPLGRRKFRRAYITNSEVSRNYKSPTFIRQRSDVIISRRKSRSHHSSSTEKERLKCKYRNITQTASSVHLRNKPFVNPLDRKEELYSVLIKNYRPPKDTKEPDAAQEKENRVVSRCISSTNRTLYRKRRHSQIQVCQHKRVASGSDTEEEVEVKRKVISNKKSKVVSSEKKSKNSSFKFKRKAKGFEEKRNHGSKKKSHKSLSKKISSSIVEKSKVIMRNKSFHEAHPKENSLKSRLQAMLAVKDLHNIALKSKDDKIDTMDKANLEQEMCTTTQVQETISDVDIIEVPREKIVPEVITLDSDNETEKSEAMKELCPIVGNEKITTDEEEDLLELRRLALESNKQKLADNENKPSLDDEVLQLRLDALRSAYLRKHMERKQRGLTLKQRSKTNTSDSSPLSPESPIISPNGILNTDHSSSETSKSPALEVPKDIVPPPLPETPPLPPSPESTPSLSCEKCTEADKSIAIVDMDLAHTDDEKESSQCDGFIVVSDSEVPLQSPYIENESSTYTREPVDNSWNSMPNGYKVESCPSVGFLEYPVPHHNTTEFPHTVLSTQMFLEQESSHPSTSDLLQNPAATAFPYSYLIAPSIDFNSPSEYTDNNMKTWEENLEIACSENVQKNSTNMVAQQASNEIAAENVVSKHVEKRDQLENSEEQRNQCYDKTDVWNEEGHIEPEMMDLSTMIVLDGNEGGHIEPEIMDLSTMIVLDGNEEGHIEPEMMDLSTMIVLDEVGRCSSPEGASRLETEHHIGDVDEDEQILRARVLTTMHTKASSVAHLPHSADSKSLTISKSVKSRNVKSEINNWKHNGKSSSAVRENANPVTKSVIPKRRQASSTVLFNKYRGKKVNVSNSKSTNLSDTGAHVRLPQTSLQVTIPTNNVDRVGHKRKVAESISLSPSQHVERFVIRVGDDSDSGEEEGRIEAIQSQNRRFIVSTPLKPFSPLIMQVPGHSTCESNSSKSLSQETTTRGISENKQAAVPVDFEKRLDLLLKQVRLQQEATKIVKRDTNIIRNQKSNATASTKRTVKRIVNEKSSSSSTPLGIRLLPSSKQEEYRRLKQQLALKEKQKQQQLSKKTSVPGVHNRTISISQNPLNIMVNVKNKTHLLKKSAETIKKNVDSTELPPNKDESHNTELTEKCTLQESQLLGKISVSETKSEDRKEIMSEGSLSAKDIILENSCGVLDISVGMVSESSSEVVLDSTTIGLEGRVEGGTTVIEVGATCAAESVCQVSTEAVKGKDATIVHSGNKVDEENSVTNLNDKSNGDEISDGVKTVDNIVVMAEELGNKVIKKIIAYQLQKRRKSLNKSEVSSTQQVVTDTEFNATTSLELPGDSYNGEHKHKTGQIEDKICQKQSASETPQEQLKNDQKGDVWARLQESERNLLTQRYNVLDDLTEMMQQLREIELERATRTECVAEMQRLRMELARAEERLRKQNDLVNEKRTTIVEAHKKMMDGRQKCAELVKGCIEIGQQMIGTKYKVPSGGAELMKTKLHQFAMYTRRARQVKRKEEDTKDDSDCSESMLSGPSTVNSSCDSTNVNCSVDVPSVSTCTKELTCDSESEVVNILDVKMQDAANVVIAKDTVRRPSSESIPSHQLQEYRSPLESLKWKTEECGDPLAILCPFELMGSCQDDDCLYLHQMTS